MASDFPDVAASLLTEFYYLHIVLHIVNMELIRLSLACKNQRGEVHKIRLRLLKKVVSS